MNTETLTSIFGVIASLGVLFAIYQHYSKRTFSRIVYEIRELSDFTLPENFYDAITQIPVSISLENTGNRHAKNALIYIKTRTDIREHEIRSAENTDYQLQSKRELKVQIPNLNPSSKLNLFIRCEKDSSPTLEIVSEHSITAAGGKVIDRKTLNYDQVYQQVLESFPLGIGRIVRILSGL